MGLWTRRSEEAVRSAEGAQSDCIMVVQAGKVYSKVIINNKQGLAAWNQLRDACACEVQVMRMNMWADGVLGAM